MQLARSQLLIFVPRWNLECYRHNVGLEESLGMGTTIERLKARKWLWVTILGLLAIGLSFGLRTLWRDFSPSAEFMSPGTVLSVRVDETLTSSNASPGDVFEARVVSARAVKGSAVPSLGVQA